MELRSWTAFWRTLTRFEAEKMTPWFALRNTIGVIVPLSAGFAFGKPTAGLVVAAGALNVAFTDSAEPYRERGRRMLRSSFLVALAVSAGGLSGRNDAAAILLAGAWAFLAGMCVCLGTPAADLGTVSLVTLVVFAAQTFDLSTAVLSGLLALTGGLFQSSLSLALWTVRRYGPERRSLAELYRELAEAAASPMPQEGSPPVSRPSMEAHRAVTALAPDHSVESERYRYLLSLAERIRLSLLALARLRERMPEAQRSLLDAAVHSLRDGLDCVARSLETDAACDPPDLSEIYLREDLPGGPAEDARVLLDSLAGLLRAATGLALDTTPAGGQALAEREERLPWRLRVSGVVATLRANLTLQSAACRHAIRLAVAVAGGDALGRSLPLYRPYWIPMTIAIVLKPDFTSTFSRGVLRLLGTLAGLALATALFHLLVFALPVQILLIGFFLFLLRWAGPAHYGVLTAAVSALVVLLVAVTGVEPRAVIAARGLNSTIGGALSLVAYALWPTWERALVPETMARMIDAYRGYFQEVTRWSPTVDHARQAARLARSNAEASVDRLSGEPNVSGVVLAVWNAMLASSHRLVHVVMALEAGLNGAHDPPPPHFEKLVHAADLELYLLAAALRGSPFERGAMPPLRDVYAEFRAAAGRDTLITVEFDRLVNSIDTLAVDVLRATSFARHPYRSELLEETALPDSR